MNISANCKTCRGRSGAVCKECNCSVCGIDASGTANPMLACLRCQVFFHARCMPSAAPSPNSTLTPFLYCTACTVSPEHKFTTLDKLEKRAAAAGVPRHRITRDLVRRHNPAADIEPLLTKHIGRIPGVYVGMTWSKRMDVSAAGVHRPPQGGIAGSGSGSAHSICLSGGYEDDKDLGESFIYTGSGGRDAKLVPVADQVLTRGNLSLAWACSPQVDDVNGVILTGDAWHKASPIRVVRSSKATKYGPREGYRYDGIYKIQSYWKEEGEGGFKVWRYMFRRDDPEPAPWTPEGTNRIARIRRAGMKLPASSEDSVSMIESR